MAREQGDAGDLGAGLGDLFPEAQGTHAPELPVEDRLRQPQGRPGSLFVAVPGTKADGMGFMPQAVAAGAAAVVGEARAPTTSPAVAYVRVPMCAARWRWRRRASIRASPDTVVAVTGTSGKSSVADFARQLFARSATRRRASARSASSPRTAPPTAR